MRELGLAVDRAAIGPDVGEPVADTLAADPRPVIGDIPEPGGFCFPGLRFNGHRQPLSRQQKTPGEPGEIRRSTWPTLAGPSTSFRRGSGGKFHHTPPARPGRQTTAEVLFSIRQFVGRAAPATRCFAQDAQFDQIGYVP
jgi:hypothetical protein